MFEISYKLQKDDFRIIILYLTVLSYVVSVSEVNNLLSRQMNLRSQSARRRSQSRGRSASRGARNASRGRSGSRGGPGMSRSNSQGRPMACGVYIVLYWKGEDFWR